MLPDMERKCQTRKKNRDTDRDMFTHLICTNASVLCFDEFQCHTAHVLSLTSNHQAAAYNAGGTVERRLTKRHSDSKWDKIRTRNMLKKIAWGCWSENFHYLFYPNSLLLLPWCAQEPFWVIDVFLISSYFMWSLILLAWGSIGRCYIWRTRHAAFSVTATVATLIARCGEESSVGMHIKINCQRKKKSPSLNNIEEIRTFCQWLGNIN